MTLDYILIELKKQKELMKEVAIIGKVESYPLLIDKSFSNSEEFMVCRLRVFAVKYKGKRYSDVLEGTDIARLDGNVFFTTKRGDLLNKLVIISEKTKCNVRIGYLKGDEGNIIGKYINCFPMRKVEDSWVLLENEVKVINSAKDTLVDFADIVNEFINTGNIEEMPDSAAYVKYNYNFIEREFLDNSNEEEELQEEVQEDKVHLEAIPSDGKVYREVAGVRRLCPEIDIVNTLNILSAEIRQEKDELVSNIYAQDEIVTPDELFSAIMSKYYLIVNNEDREFFSMKVGTEISYDVIGELFDKILGSNLVKQAKKMSDAIGISEYELTFNYMIFNPYIFAFLVSGMSISSCDKLVSLLVEVGFGSKVSIDGREAMMFRQEAMGTNDTLIRDFREYKKVTPKPIKNCVICNSGWWDTKEDKVPFDKCLRNFLMGTRFLGKGYIDWIYMEAFVADRLKEIADRNGSRVSQERINEVVDALPFQLEEKQLEALNHCESGVVVIPGCAGSGKTTIANCIKDIIGGRIQYAAPTGKAARRLSESVGETVKTLHSLFRLPIGNTGILYPILPVIPVDLPADVFIIDECAMINLANMYTVLRKVTHQKLIMMGDSNQLQPIGKGAIFRDMVSFLNPVKLSVSKRFASGSMVGANCKTIVEGGTSLSAGPGFDMVSCEDTAIARSVISIFLDKVNNFGLEQLQIATPYVTPKKAWSSSNLNSRIQESLVENYFNKPVLSYMSINGSVTPIVEGTKMVHTSTNVAGRVHYKMEKEGDTYYFTSLTSNIGVFNGDVGYVVAILPLSNCVIDNSSAKDAFSDLDIAEEYESSVTDVLVFEVDGEYILYGGKKRNTNDGIVFTGSEVRDLDLAYALTVHKLQGSEYSSILFPISSYDNVKFVSNEMVYTAISRAKQECTVVGSIPKVADSLKFRVSPLVNTMLWMFK